MDEFTAELRARVLEAREKLRQAHDDRDEYDIQVLSGRLDNLLRLASEHGIDAQPIVSQDAGEES
ncbi:hypothetical protein N5079_12220 [Planotetraspora sp. A-T 1434]|uniref:hypothetical protein n=1 Tax=Planotetraspora sp. A-T 1434 TaxID=2979219 RepID=UPI0021BFCAC1|nr:hypothetical protein [Planotetraspora sp. A-T 1434]MCT9930983.1 hypothetical protein [Planotetraspora sp. A-T 1434]